MIPPLDTHAHIEPDISPAELVALRACVVAVTRRLEDYESTRHRTDLGVVWGVGCHPGLVREVRGFSEPRMREAITTTPVIGEVGLDATARTPMDAQLAVFRGVLRIAADVPRLVSIHSYRATDLVLRELRECPISGAILHWWLGTEAETDAAVDCGAYFSVNASQTRKWGGLRHVPRDRILIETDHPFGDRSEAQPRRPGNIRTAEIATAEALRTTTDELRQRTWRTFGQIAESLSLCELFPTDFQVQFLGL